MTTRIVIEPSEGIQKEFVAKVQSWANEVLEKKGSLAAPTFISINIWRHMNELQSFYQQEKQELGIVTGEETNFLATHEAWRGDPRIHICQEKVKNVSMDSIFKERRHYLKVKRNSSKTPASRIKQGVYCC